MVSMVLIHVFATQEWMDENGHEYAWKLASLMSNLLKVINSLPNEINNCPQQALGLY